MWLSSCVTCGTALGSWGQSKGYRLQSDLLQGPSDGLLGPGRVAGINGTFRAEVGRVILIDAIVYCALLTIILTVGTYYHSEISQPARDIVIIILTWFTTKAGTVVDHQFGSSQGSDVYGHRKRYQLREFWPSKMGPP